MKIKTPQDYQQRVLIAKALAHASRMLILDVLQSGERCVSDLTELVGADQSTISKHIAVLKNAGLVESRKENLKVFYRLTCPCIETFFTCLEQMVTGGEQEENRSSCKNC